MFSSSSNKPKAHCDPGSEIPKQDRRDQRKPSEIPASEFALAYNPSYHASPERGLVSHNSEDKMERRSSRSSGNDYPRRKGPYNHATPKDDEDPTPPRRLDLLRHVTPAKSGKVEATQTPTSTTSDDDEYWSKE